MRNPALTTPGSSLFSLARRAWFWPQDRWWKWRMKPGGEACGAWIRVVRDCWIAEMGESQDWADTADSSASALDSIYGFMVAHGWMCVDAGVQDGPTLPLQAPLVEGK